jgi:hypothetical protein
MMRRDYRLVRSEMVMLLMVGGLTILTYCSRVKRLGSLFCMYVWDQENLR